MTTLTWIPISCVVVAVITYLITRIALSNRVHEATVQAVTERTKREAHEEFLKRLHVEQEVSIRIEGWIFKSKYVVVHERMCLDELPITGWVQHEKLTHQELNEEALKRVAKAASLLIGPGSGRKIVTKLLSLALDNGFRD